MIKQVSFVFIALATSGAFAASLYDNRVLSDEERIAAIAPARPGELVLEPTFASCSVKFGAEKGEPLTLEYRPKGGEWRKALTPHYFADVHEYRGSLVELQEDTEYEVRVVSGEVKIGGEGEERNSTVHLTPTPSPNIFRTWKTEVPIARRIVLDPAKVKFPIVVSDRGTPDGWVAYTAKGPLVNPGRGDHFTVSNAAYVVFENMDLSGGEYGHVFRLEYSKDIRLRNLNIHHWGQVGVPSYTERDLGRIVRRPGQWAVNDHAFMVGLGMRNTVIERCWVHDQNSRSVSWYYSHPYGQVAVAMKHPDGNTVIRWNDFIGSDEHRWDDSIPGPGNFQEDGGFHRDGDVYGNYLCFANDDGIELDGGQQNIRVWNNRIDLCYTAVSLQGNTVSPSYVWRNWFGPCIDEFGLRGQTIKTSGLTKGARGDSVTYVWSNTLGGGGWGEPMHLVSGAFINFWDNLALNAAKPWNVRKPGDDDRTTFGSDSPTPGAVKPGETPTMWPIRPLPFILSEQSLDFGAAHTAMTVRAIWTGGTVKPVAFEIAQNTAFDWFEVSPKRGVIGRDGLEFTVRYTAKSPTRHFLRGVFLVRTPEGLSRPCSVFAETDYVLPLFPHRPGEYADYRTNLVADAKGWYSAEFEVARRGTYYFMVRGKGCGPVVDARLHPQFLVSVDGAKPEISRQQTDVFTTWTMLTPGCKFGKMLRSYELEPGRHTLRLKLKKNGFDLEALALTDSPGSFERR